MPAHCMFVFPWRPNTDIRYIPAHCNLSCPWRSNTKLRGRHTASFDFPGDPTPEFDAGTLHFPISICAYTPVRGKPPPLHLSPGSRNTGGGFTRDWSVRGFKVLTKVSTRTPTKKARFARQIRRSVKPWRPSRWRAMRRPEAANREAWRLQVRRRRRLSFAMH